ncbi:711_t:CDS:2, partial [Dentiscutata heterogama]
MLYTNLKGQKWPEHQFTEARKALNDMIDSPLITLQNSQVVHNKRCPSGAQNQQPTSSTTRDPSGFELIDNK